MEWRRGVVHPWQCDAMGHFTTRFFAAMFDDAAYRLGTIAIETDHDIRFLLRRSKNNRG